MLGFGETGAAPELLTTCTDLRHQTRGIVFDGYSSWCRGELLTARRRRGATLAVVVISRCTDLREPFCAAEHWLTLFAMMLGVMFQSLVVSTISSILVEMSLLQQRHRGEMRTVDAYMRQKRLPPELRTRVFDYFKVALQRE